MSGGHYHYLYHSLNQLAEAIEQDFKKDGIVQEESWPNTAPYPGRNLTKEVDLLEGANKTQREYILIEVKSLIYDLKQCAHRAKELEKFLSGDTDIQTYIDNVS